MKTGVPFTLHGVQSMPVGHMTGLLTNVEFVVVMESQKVRATVMETFKTPLASAEVLVPMTRMQTASVTT